MRIAHNDHAIAAQAFVQVTANLDHRCAALDLDPDKLRTSDTTHPVPSNQNAEVA